MDGTDESRRRNQLSKHFRPPFLKDFSEREIGELCGHLVVERVETGITRSRRTAISFL